MNGHRALHVLLAALALSLLASCMSPGPAAPVTGAIWDVRARRFATKQELVEALAGAHFRLLGERHDNPVHHTLRARLVTALAATGARPAVVFEQFDVDHDEALVAAQGSGIDAERVADAGRLDRKAWSWPLHKPIVDAALAVPLPVRAGNLPRAALRGNVQSTIDAEAAPGWALRLRATPWSDAQASKLDEDIVRGHCGKLPASVVPRIALAQRARDAAMAQAVVDAATSTGTILIAGNGHVRADLGVPAYLRATGLRGADARFVTVAFVETAGDGALTPVRAERWVAVHPGFDYLWFTAAVTREDPCERMVAPGPVPR